MNFLEHTEVLTEKLRDIYFGKVIKNNDPDELRRVKVRVLGVFDEPISKDDIPWAMPLIESDKVPVLGEFVGVLFRGDDIYQPTYITASQIDVAQRDFKKSLYQAIIDSKKSSVKTGISVVEKTFSEPSTDADNSLPYNKKVELIPEDVSSETKESYNLGSPSTGFLDEVDMIKGKERSSVNHPSGSFHEFTKDGSCVLHLRKNDKGNYYLIIEGDKNTYIGGDSLIKVIGDLRIDVDGDIKIKTGSTTLTLSTTQVEIDTPSIKGNNKNVPPTGTGPFCGLPNCVFSGVKHSGNIANI